MAASLSRTPRDVSIAITGKCNLKCRYCFYADEMVALKDLATEDWLNFFKQLGDANVMKVTLTGGEVFSRRDLFELIDGVIANRMRYSLLSNGTLITEKVIQQFDVGKRRTRLDSIQISIDGSCADIHNKSRPDSFDRAIRGLRLLKEAGLPATVRVTLNSHNLHDLENIAHLLLEDIGLPTFSTNEAMPIGAACDQQARQVLSAPERLAAMEVVGRLLERYPGRMVADAGPQALKKMYFQMSESKKTGLKMAPDMGYLTGCGGVFNKLDILHDGTMVPCHIMYGVELGNIKTDDFEDTWVNHPALRALRDRRAIPMQEVPGCETCEWASYCRGGCPGLAHQVTEDFNLACPVSCYRRFLNEIGEHRDSQHHSR